MITQEQFFLLKLMEECAEVSHRAAKQFQFGRFEVEPNQIQTNLMRLQNEFIDLVSVAKLLSLRTSVTNDEFENKVTKLRKYKEYSESIKIMKVAEYGKTDVAEYGKTDVDEITNLKKRIYELEHALASINLHP